MKRILTILIILNLSIGILYPSYCLSNSVEEKFIKAGLVDISKIDKTIKVDLVNSDPKNNFFRVNYYNGLNKAYLRKPVAEKLSKAQEILKEKQPTYSLQILDAARPRSVSKAMYEKMKGNKNSQITI